MSYSVPSESIRQSLFTLLFNFWDAQMCILTDFFFLTIFFHGCSRSRAGHVAAPVAAAARWAPTAVTTILELWGRQSGTGGRAAVVAAAAGHLADLPAAAQPPLARQLVPLIAKLPFATERAEAFAKVHPNKKRSVVCGRDICFRFHNSSIACLFSLQCFFGCKRQHDISSWMSRPSVRTLPQALTVSRTVTDRPRSMSGRHSWL